MKTQFSVVTIVQSRAPQLANLISSIEKASVIPQELVVVWMGAPCSESLLKSEHFHIQHRFSVDDTLPIAQARNKGFNSCSHDIIFYIDADCICTEDLFSHFLATIQPKVIVTSAIRYLSNRHHYADNAALDSLTLELSHDSIQNEPVLLNMEHDFTTTIFGICKQDYDAVDGFDEDYSGYGVGDIDFARRCHVGGISLKRVGAAVLFQHHPYCDPPINHLPDIIANANRYKQKWGSYPLQRYLKQFAEEGFIHSDYQATGLRVRRLPTEEEIKSHMKY